MARDYEILKDDSMMPFGKKYKGIPMRDVPAKYLVWLVEEATGCSASVRDYVMCNKLRIYREAGKPYPVMGLIDSPVRRTTRRH